jgi:hypothetical protein
MNYFAVELLRDTPHQLMEMVIRTAAQEGYTFRACECLDRIQVGSTWFQRFRIPANETKLLEVLYQAGRATIGKGEGRFIVRLKNRQGPVPFSTIQAAPKSTTKYRGPGDPFWERQFER